MEAEKSCESRLFDELKDVSRRPDLMTACTKKKFEQSITSSPMNDSRIPVMSDGSAESLEYTYLMIASPSISRKTNMGKMSSFLSDSSNNTDTSPSATPLANIPRSKGVLLAAKNMLKAEIKKIDQEIEKMENEKAVLLNLRNLIIDFRNSVSQVDRNRQNVPNASKMRVAVGNISLTIEHVCHMLQGSLQVPCQSELLHSFTELKKISAVIVENKTGVQVPIFEEFAEIIGRLFGTIESILLLLYEDEEGDAEMNPSQASLELDAVDAQQLSAIPTNLPQFAKLNENVTNILCSTKNITTSISSIKNLEHLRTFLKNVSKARKCLQQIDRLSSGTPRVKSLKHHFKEINRLLGEEEACEQTDAVLLQLSENLMKLKDNLSVEHPSQKQLDQIKILLGELTGRLKVILKLSD